MEKKWVQRKVDTCILMVNDDFKGKRKYADLFAQLTSTWCKNNYYKYSFI